MRLKCRYVNAEGINGLVSHGQTLVHVGVFLLAVWALILEVIAPLCELGSGHARL